MQSESFEYYKNMLVSCFMLHEPCVYKIIYNIILPLYLFTESNIRIYTIRNCNFLMINDHQEVYHNVYVHNLEL